MLGKLRRELRGEVVGLTPSQTLGEGSERGLGGLFCLLARLHMAAGLYHFDKLVVLYLILPIIRSRIPFCRLFPALLARRR